MKFKSFFNKYGHFFIPALATVLIMFIAFAIKGVFPFGKGYIGIIDYSSGLVPSYTHLWDFMHGENNFLFEENLGMGSNIYASSVLNTFFSPISYFIGVFSRENIQYGIGYVVVLKMMLMATTFYIVTRKWFKNTDNKTLWVFSLLWTFSSWLLVHISNIGWLDVMIVFPFLIESLKVIIEKGKISYFVGMLALCLIFSYYMSYMILIMMIIGIICVNRYLVDTKEDKRRIIGQVFVGTLFALLLSMFAFLPSFIQTQASYRFNDTFNTGDSYTYSKLAMMLFYGVIIYLPFKLFKGHRDDKNVKFLLLFSFFTLLPLLVEPINKMWHTGSYFSYPFRYSYIPIFFLLVGCLYYLEKYFDNDQKEHKVIPNKGLLLSVLCMSMFLLYFMCLLKDFYIGFHLAFPREMLTFMIDIFQFILVITLIVMCMKVLNKQHRKNALLLISIFQILGYSIGYMGYNGSEPVDLIYEYTEELEIDSLDKKYAIKDETRELMFNFPLIMEQKSVSTWLHINGYYANINAQALGYGTSSTQISSYGGTVFSDLLSNTRYVISYEELDDSLYTLLKESKVEVENVEKKLYLYEYKYNLPLGLIVDKEISFEDFDKNANPFDTQNMIYNELFGEGELIEVNEYKKIKENTIVYDVNETESVYLYVENAEYENIKIYVNDVEKDYVSGNGIVNLGVFKEDINIKIVSEEVLDKVYVANIDVDDIKDISLANVNDTQIVYDGNKVNVKVTSYRAGKIYLPINYENGSWSAINNDNSVEVERFLHAYLAVDIQEGENNIILTFTPQKMDLGIKLSIVTLALLAILFVINRKYEFFKKKKFRNCMYYIGVILGLAVFAYVYIIPLTK